MNAPEPIYRPTRPLPDQPATDIHRAALRPVSGSVELYGERRVAWVPDPYNPNQSVPIDARLIQPTPHPTPRDLTPQPLVDPIAARMAGAGLGTGLAGAGVGWGFGQAAAGIATMGGTSALVGFALLLLVAKLNGRRTQQAGDTYITNISHENRWWGRSETDVRNH